MIKRIQLKEHSLEWHLFRDRGYGASEIPSVLAEYFPDLAPYVWTDPIKTHLHKIGEDQITYFTGNELSYMGHEMEPIILNFYRYWDDMNPSQLRMHENKNAGIKKKKVRQASYFQVNSKYPWLFASPDGKEHSNEEKIYLECKNTNSMEANRYPLRVSPSFIIQVQQGLLVTGLKKAKILVFIDGSWLEVYSVYPDLEIQEKIIEYSKKSWARVEFCREVKKLYRIPYYFGMNPDFFSADQREGVRILQENEPQLTGSQSEWEFIKENVYTTEADLVTDATDDQFGLVTELNQINDELRDLKFTKNIKESELRLSLGGYNKAVFRDIPGEPFFSDKPDVNGNKRLYISKELKEIKSKEFGGAYS